MSSILQKYFERGQSTEFSQSVMGKVVALRPEAL